MTDAEIDAEQLEKSRVGDWQPPVARDAEYARKYGYRMAAQTVYMRFACNWHYIRYFNDAAACAVISNMPPTWESHITYYAIQCGMAQGIIDLSLQKPEFAYVPDCKKQQCGPWGKYLMEQPPHLAHLNKKRRGYRPNLKDSC